MYIHSFIGMPISTVDAHDRIAYSFETLQPIHWMCMRTRSKWNVSQTLVGFLMKLFNCSFFSCDRCKVFKTIQLIYFSFWFNFQLSLIHFDASDHYLENHFSLFKYAKLVSFEVPSWKGSEFKSKRKCIDLEMTLSTQI